MSEESSPQQIANEALSTPKHVEGSIIASPYEIDHITMRDLPAPPEFIEDTFPNENRYGSPVHYKDAAHVDENGRAFDAEDQEIFPQTNVERLMQTHQQEAWRVPAGRSRKLGYTATMAHRYGIRSAEYDIAYSKALKQGVEAAYATREQTVAAEIADREISTEQAVALLSYSDVLTGEQAEAAKQNVRESESG